MPEVFDCPATERWQTLLSDAVPPDQRARYERHLESCPACQERLDRANECEETMRTLVRRVGNPTAVEHDTSMVALLDRLREVKSPLSAAAVEPPGLYFLQPADRPDILGMLGVYEVEEVISQGGMGVVLKALDPGLHRPVAIKVMAAAIAGGSASARQRFTREAKAAAAVCHEHIVTVYGVFEMDGLPYLVTQYIEGESVQTRLDRCGPLEVMDIVRIGYQTALGLAAAHAQGLIHRDIKPANLLLETGLARVRIIDFGLARMTDDVQLTQTGMVAGTPAYMAPEQARGETVDYRADLYCLGSVLYACCTGVAPFRGPTTLALLRQVSEEEPTPLRSLNPNVPVWLESLINRLMAKNPAERFQSALEVAALLEGYLAHLQQPATVSVPQLPPPLAKDCPALKETGWRRGVVERLSLGIWLAALVLLVVLGLGLGYLFQGDVPPPQRPVTEISQDFRDNRPLSPAFKLIGRDADGAIKPDDKGLLIKLSPDRKVHDAVGVATTFSLKGDFVLTATYELLFATRPSGGYGTGISLSVANDPQRHKFAKVGRFQRAAEGSVYASEFWNNNPPPDKDWQFQSESTKAPSGQLRLVREGSLMHFLVADVPDNKFHQIDERQFGTEDLALVQLEVVDSGTVGNRVDARLVELKIRSGTLPVEDKVSDPTQPLEQERKAESRGWLLLVEILGVVSTLVLMSAVCVWLYLRQNRRGGTLPARVTAKDTEVKTETTAPPISFACAACGKNLKAKVELAGKKVKRTQCAKPVLVPSLKTS